MFFVEERLIFFVYVGVRREVRLHFFVHKYLIETIRDMGKYLKKFSSHSDYVNYISDNPLLPSVSICDEGHLHFVPKRNSLKKIDDYIYYADYEDIDYSYARRAMSRRFPQPMACSSVRNGIWYGRNLDFYFNTTVEMVVRTPAKDDRHAVLGVMGCMDEIDRDFCESYEMSSIYKLVPFQIVDGINDSGVVANINVVPAGDKGYTTGSIPLVEKRDTICGAMLVRYILDNFSSAQTAVEYIRDYVSVYAPQAANLHFEYHYMVADADNTYVLEFVNNQCSVINVNSHPWMTNFYLTGVTFDSNNKVSYTESGLTPYSSGVERSNLIADNYEDTASFAGMSYMMTENLRYTKAYEFGTYTPFWYTEFAGDALTMEVIANPDYREAIDELMAYYNSSEFRNGYWTGTEIPRTTRAKGIHGTWETSHTSIYNMEDRKLYLWAKEESDTYIFSLDDGILDEDVPSSIPEPPVSLTYIFESQMNDMVVVGPLALQYGQSSVIDGSNLADAMIYSENGADLYDYEGNFLYRYEGGVNRHLTEFENLSNYANETVFLR